MMQRHIEINHQRYAKPSDVGSHLSSTLKVLRVFCATYFWKLRGYPLGLMLASLEYTWSDFLDFLEELMSSISILREEIASTTPSKTQTRINKYIPTVNPNESLFTFVV